MMLRNATCLPIVLVLSFILSSPALAGRTERTSISSSNDEANSDSRPIAPVSEDGTLVAFASSADNLVPGDTNGCFDIFLRDRTAGTTERISVSTGGSQADGASHWPVMSDNGQFVAFFSYATNLVAGDTNGKRDVFLRDTVNDTTTLLSQSAGGVSSNGVIDSLAINSLAGQGAVQPVVVFCSNADNLVGDDTNGTWDIFVRDSGITTRVSVASSGAEANGPSFAPTVSGDGRYVAFESYADNLVSGDTNGRADIFVRDRIMDITTRVSLKDDDTEALLGDNTACSMSADGTYVSFVSTASDMVSGDTNGKTDIFLRNLTADTTAKVSNGMGGTQANGMSYQPAVSSDGSYVTFISDAGNLVAGDTNGAFDVFRYQRSDGAIIRVSVADDDSEAAGRSYCRGISSTGRYVTFLSYASNLVSGDTNETGDIFLRDIDATGTGTGGTTSGTAAIVGTGSTARVSISNTEEQGNGDGMTDAGVSDDGRYVAFASDSSNLVADDTNGVTDIFIRDDMNGTTIRVEGLGGVQPDGASFSPMMSNDGEYIVFASHATNLAGTDLNTFPDIFIYSRTAGSTTRITNGNGPSIDPAISPNGRYVTFSSLASTLVAADVNTTWDIFVYDRFFTMTTRVSVSGGGVEGNAASTRPSVNNTGTVAYESQASNLITGDTNGRDDIFVYEYGTVERISVTTGGVQDYSGPCREPVISGDGTVVAFEAWGWELFPDDSNGTPDIVMHNRTTNAITRITNGATESNGWSLRPKISSDGQYVAFMCDADNMLAGDTNQAFDVFLYNSSGGVLERVSLAYNGSQADDRSYVSAMSGDGNFILFHSYDSGLVQGDTNGKGDIFLRDRSGQYIPSCVPVPTLLLLLL